MFDGPAFLLYIGCLVPKIHITLLLFVQLIFFPVFNYIYTAVCKHNIGAIYETSIYFVVSSYLHIIACVVVFGATFFERDESLTHNFVLCL
jgi:hypothetical protein